MERRYYQIVSLIFSLFIGAFFLVNLILPDRDFSPNENRALQTFPHFSLAALADGSFTEKAEKYTSEQFALRDRWIELKACLELLQVCDTPAQAAEACLRKEALRGSIRRLEDYTG